MKHSDSKFQDQDSSSTLSTGQSHNEGVTMAASNSYMHCISPELGCNEIYGRRLEGSLKSSLPLGNPTSTIPQLQFDYNQPMAQISYRYVDPYFAGLLAVYGPNSMICPQMIGLTSEDSQRLALPPDLAGNFPIHVNPKQYHGILRRRQARAKLVAQNKLARTRKPYLHESRHLHALNRARGSGGRFLNTNNLQKSKPSSSTKGQNLSQLHLAENFSGLGFHRSETANLGPSTPSGSDVTSIFNNDDIFQQSKLTVSKYPLRAGPTTHSKGDIKR